MLHNIFRSIEEIILGSFSIICSNNCNEFLENIPNNLKTVDSNIKEPNNLCIFHFGDEDMIQDRHIFFLNSYIHEFLSRNCKILKNQPKIEERYT